MLEAGQGPILFLAGIYLAVKVQIWRYAHAVFGSFNQYKQVKMWWPVLIFNFLLFCVGFITPKYRIRNQDEGGWEDVQKSDTNFISEFAYFYFDYKW